MPESGANGHPGPPAHPPAPRARRGGQRGQRRGDNPRTPATAAAHGPPSDLEPGGPGTAPVTGGGGERKPRRRNNNRGPKKSQDGLADESTGDHTTARDPLPHQHAQPAKSRREQFGGRLTSDSNNNLAPRQQHAHAASGASQSYVPQPNPQATDLTNRLVHSLSTPPYADCAMYVHVTSHHT